jgi:hypothetical protein
MWLEPSEMEGPRTTSLGYLERGIRNWVAWRRENRGNATFIALSYTYSGDIQPRYDSEARSCLAPRSIRWLVSLLAYILGVRGSMLRRPPHPPWGIIKSSTPLSASLSHEPTKYIHTPTHIFYSEKSNFSLFQITKLRYSRLGWTRSYYSIQSLVYGLWFRI